MKKFTPLVILGFLVLSACQSSSLSESESSPVPESETAFSGNLREIDKSKSVISFIGKSDVVDHEGKFNDYVSTVTLDPQNPADLEKASITVDIDIASVEVDSEGLQGHLLRDDFFAAETYPRATFVSTKIVSMGENRYEVTGDLTLKGVTKSVVITAEITDDYLMAQYELPRKDFGIGNDTYGQKLLASTVPVNVKLVFQK